MKRVAQLLYGHTLYEECVVNIPKDTMDHEHLVKTAAMVGLALPKCPSKEQLNQSLGEIPLKADQKNSTQTIEN
ncbi:hypothetical protein DI09_12p310 [Mitosporidium daphniae]|uniref:Uncharacterized protein n=1 Tax=Mitosporidium daphniae TaxID=1485682 RepID=A0A098VUW7_9MICR|nr:uncharacterized protein DI09_12p310 [Mitosporidium daphniae]KGG52863.1 hypothetical protein DI09_12p310 [Mitosporidium daphniae]|eukprot:XP_013239290.1 uncharacterized protein DI09_12p310 [Mitosporidium daphniae]